LLDVAEQYLKAEKKFTENPDRMKVVVEAFYKGNELFADAEIEILPDPLQLGSLILQIVDYQLDVSAEREIKSFNEIVSKANNFAFFPKGDEKVELAIIFHDVYTVEGK
jgi:hypothetical protein